MRNKYNRRRRQFLGNCRQAICITVCNIQQHKWPLSQLETIMVLSLGLRFLSFFKGALLPNFNKIVKRDLLVIGARQLKHIFSIVAMNVHAWLNVLCLGTNDLNWASTLFTL